MPNEFAMQHEHTICTDDTGQTPGTYRHNFYSKQWNLGGQVHTNLKRLPPENIRNATIDDVYMENRSLEFVMDIGDI